MVYNEKMLDVDSLLWKGLEPSKLLFSIRWKWCRRLQRQIKRLWL